jgi:hypothetical protein
MECWNRGMMGKKNKTQSSYYCIGFLALMEYCNGEKQKTNVWCG